MKLILIVIIAIGALHCPKLFAHEFNWEPYADFTHVSAAFKSQPWNDREETSYDAANICVDITHNRLPRFALNLCEGYKWGSINNEENSSFSIKYYFGRGK